MIFQTESFWRRIELAQAAWAMFKSSPILGIGLGNFTPRLPQFFIVQKLFFWQPVHNIFLLLLAETGVIGVWCMVYGVWYVLKKLWWEEKWSLALALTAIIATGLLDHYWLTLQQTQLLFCLIIGLSLRYDGKDDY